MAVDRTSPHCIHNEPGTPGRIPQRRNHYAETCPELRAVSETREDTERRLHPLSARQNNTHAHPTRPHRSHQTGHGRCRDLDEHASRRIDIPPLWDAHRKDQHAHTGLPRSGPDRNDDHPRQGSCADTRCAHPLFWQHLQSREGQQTTNSGSDWLFPGTRAGRPISPETLLHNIRESGIAIQGVRNQTIRGLVEELDPTSLANLTGYATITLSRHATAATVPWSAYVTDKNPRYATERQTSDVKGQPDESGQTRQDRGHPANRS